MTTDYALHRVEVKLEALEKRVAEIEALEYEGGNGAARRLEALETANALVRSRTAEARSAREACGDRVDQVNALVKAAQRAEFQLGLSETGLRPDPRARESLKSALKPFEREDGNG